MCVMLLRAAILALSVAATPLARELPQVAAPSVPASASAPAPVATLRTDSEIEAFLGDARIASTKKVTKGVTGSVRATLTDGTLSHDAQIQVVDEKKAQFDARGGTEFNFEDSWKYNVAAYRVDRLIGLNMVPVSIARSWRSKPAAFTWWIDDVMMDEGKRLKDQTQPADSGRWNEQLQLVRIFDQLIYNMDRNTGNMLIGNDWRVWAIDHTRAFRTHSTLRSAADITRCDRQVLERLKTLDRDSLKRAVGKYLSDFQINGLLARRDKIVELIEKGGPAALFDRK